MENQELYVPILEKATQQNSKIITEFQYAMAKETEDKELNRDDVFKAVDYLALNPNYGFFLMAYSVNEQKQRGSEIGSLLITYAHEVFLNKAVWWFQSVFVDEVFRGKRIFKQMFENIQQQVEEKKYPLKLYVEVENQKAMKVYQKMGMFDAQEAYLEDDFYFEDKTNFQQTSNYSFQLQDLANDSEVGQIIEKVQGFKSECGYEKINVEEVKKSINKLKQAPEQGGIIKILQNNEIIGAVGFFYEFSDWRNGLILYLSDIRFDGKITAEISEEIYNGLFYWCKKEFKMPLPLTCLRVIINERLPAVEIIKKVGMEQAHYRVYMKTF